VIAALLGWTKLPQWALELIVLAALAGGFWLYHIHVYDQGIRAQQTADKAVSAKAMAQAAVATQAAQDAANRAEESYREEIASNAAAAVARPIGPVRLCIDAHIGGSSVPEASTAHSGDAGSSASTGGIPGVPDRDPGLRAQSGHDISSLLGAWADTADKVSAALREYQARNSQSEIRP